VFKIEKSDIYYDFEKPKIKNRSFNVITKSVLDWASLKNGIFKAFCSGIYYISPTTLSIIYFPPESFCLKLVSFLEIENNNTEFFFISSKEKIFNEWKSNRIRILVLDINYTNKKYVIPIEDWGITWFLNNQDAQRKLKDILCINIKAKE